MLFLERDSKEQERQTWDKIKFFTNGSVVFMSFLKVPLHVITVGEVRYDWFECNLLKMIKVHQQG